MAAGDFRVEGEDQLLHLGRRLRDAGRGDVLKELTKELRLTVKPTIPRARAVARRTLPQRGGLAARVAKAPIRVTVRAGNTTSRVSLVVPGKKKGNASTQTDRGFVRHPVFNRMNSSGRRIFVRQETPAATGWFSGTVRDEAPRVRTDLAQVLDKYAQRISRGL